MSEQNSDSMGSSSDDTGEERLLTEITRSVSTSCDPEAEVQWVDEEEEETEGASFARFTTVIPMTDRFAVLHGQRAARLDFPMETGGADEVFQNELNDNEIVLEESQDLEPSTQDIQVDEYLYWRARDDLDATIMMFLIFILTLRGVLIN